LKNIKERRALDNCELVLAADVVLQRLGLTAADAFLVVSNPELTTVASALAEAARARTPNVRMHEFAATSRDGEEPPETVAAAMIGTPVIAIVTRFSLSHTHARAAATDAGARIASMPGITSEIFGRAIPIDYDQLQRDTRALTQALTDADLCRVTSPRGTEIELVVSGRSAISDDGDLCAPAAWGNLPAGEAFIAPLENEAHGSIVFDGSLAGWGILENALTIELRQGRAVTARGGPAAEWLLNTLDAGGENGRVLAELGIGTNPGATISGQILEDEKVEGTVHFAFGTNTSFGGVNQATVHIDGLVRDATVELDGCLMLSD
jgi:leucyl aminopeptidase (aminopeptidase T)